MAIIIRLDRVLADRKVKSVNLANKLGLSPLSLSRLKTGKVKAVKIETMDGLCKLLDCQPADIFEYVPDDECDGLFGIDD